MNVSLPPVLLSVGNVDNPASIVNPVTPIDTGDDDLVNPLIFAME